MKNPKNDFNLITMVKMVKVAAFYIVELYKSTKKQTISPKIVVPNTKKTLLQRFLPSFFSNLPSLFLNPNFWFYGSGIILSILILNGAINLSNENLDLSNKNKNSKKFPQFPFFLEKKPEKRIIALHLCSPLCSQRSVGQYVVFKEKNKDNSSLVNITFGEVGKIIKKLKGWDRALVNFSIEVPSHFQKLDTKSIIANIFNEGVVIGE